MELKVLLLLVCAGLVAVTVGGLCIYYCVNLTQYLCRQQKGKLTLNPVTDSYKADEAPGDTDVERRGQRHQAVPTPIPPIPPMHPQRHRRQPVPGPLGSVFCIEDIVNPPPQYRVPVAHMTHWRPPRPRPVRRFIVSRMPVRKPFALRVPARLAYSAAKSPVSESYSHYRPWTPSSDGTIQEECDLLPLLSQYPPPPSPWTEDHPASRHHEEHLDLLRRAEEYRQQRLPRRMPSSVYENDY